MKLTRRKFLKVSSAVFVAAGCGSGEQGGADADAAGLDAARDAPGWPDALVPDGEEPADAESPADAAADDAADAATPDASASLDPTPIFEAADMFPLGVMAGDARSDAAIVWARYSAPTPLVLRVLEMDGDRIAALAYEGPAAASPDGFVHVDVPGLRPGRRYRYAFLMQNRGRFVGRSPIGRFRTALADDALEVVTFAGTSCTNQSRRPFPTMAHAARRGDLDFFVHSGDMTYCDGARTLDEFRGHYRENWSSAGFQSLFRATGFYITWDDHEIDNNWNPENTDPNVVANARRTWFDHTPTRRDPTAPERLWRSYRWGRTLELFVLDTRGERRPSTRRTAEAQYISREQMAWLKLGLMRSNAVFKFVVNSVPIANFPGVFDVQASDRWEGYDAQRNEILNFIQSNAIQGVWWLSGDFHLGSVVRLESSGAFSRMREVLMGPGGNSANPATSTLGGSQFDFVTGESTYTVFRVDPTARTLEVTFVNGSGREVFFRRYAYNEP